MQEKGKLQRSLRSFDMVFFTVCAIVGLDVLGTVSTYGPQGFTWLVVLALLFLIPYALVMTELGSSFTQEGGPYEWVKMTMGRFQAVIAAVLYWVTNPLWVGGSLAFVATDAWSAHIHAIGSGYTIGNIVFKLAFIWFSIGVAIVSLRRGKWIPNVGAFARVLVLGTFTVTVVIYGIEHGLHTPALGDFKPTAATFIGLVPLLLFAFVGFELQNGAAEEMENPSRDVPLSILRSGSLAVLLYAIPIFGILLVLPLSKVTSIGGFLDAVTETFSVYGGAQDFMVDMMVIGFIFALLTSGAVWMMGSDRILAVASLDGAFPPYFGVFNERFGTPVRVNVMSGIASTIFMLAAVKLLNSGSADAFVVVLTIAITTTLLSYLWIFATGILLRRSHPHVRRPYRLGASGNGAMWVCTILILAWTVLGSWVALFPGTIESAIGVDYGSFTDAWGVSRLKFEVLTFGTLIVVVAVAAVGYMLAEDTRRHTVDVALPAEGEAPAPAS
jgi:amino acid transporter